MKSVGTPAKDMAVDEALASTSRTACRNTDEDLEKVFAQAAEHKPRAHHLNSKDETTLSGRMSAIGG